VDAVELAEGKMLPKVHEDQKIESPVNALGQEFKERVFPSWESGLNDQNKRFATDICKAHFRKIVGCSLLFFQYVIVLPCAEWDLSSIIKHKRLSVIKICKCLQALRDQYKFTIL
jgi:hypothetical protein